MNALKIALQFLTRLPVRSATYDDADVKASIYWYGVVGLIIGALLALTKTALLWLAPYLDSQISAAVLLCLWVLVTGALHLDGLADSADAWIGGKDTNSTLAIMKDPRCGPAGVVSILLVLILKFACLNALVTQSAWLLLLAPLSARALLPALFLHTPYVRESGLATPFREGLSVEASQLPLIPCAILWFVLLGWGSLPALLVFTAVFLGLRQLMIKRIGGTTGDTAGALVEIMEAVVLLLVSIVIS